MTNITSNTDEYSATITRQDGSKLDFCAFRADKTLTIGLTSGEQHQKVVLSADEASALLDYLLDQRTQQTLK